MGKAAVINGDVLDLVKFQAGVLDFTDTFGNNQLFWQSVNSKVDFFDAVRESDFAAKAMPRGCPLMEQHRTVLPQP